ncbi:MAG TPA: hypothetical protein VM509_04010, partial [Planctomycetota bacterium]|nr:hypothetical protein [Planctomycetota bacterium]
PAFVAAPTRSAFVQFARTERFAALRAGGIAVVRGDAVRGKSVRRLPLPAPTTGSRRWFVDNSATTLDWDALTVRSVSARGPRATDQGDAPLLGWNASGLAEGQTQGIWIDHAGEPRAYFAVADSVDWLCAGRILLAWPVAGWSDLSGADAQDDLPHFEPPAQFVVEGDDWRVTSIDAPLVAAAQATLARRGSSGTCSLTFCNLETLEQRRFELVPELPPAGGSAKNYAARGAGRAAAAWSARDESFAWSVEYAARGVVLVREDGLVVPKDAEAR